MAEPGWPLIPREVLPAPVPAVKPERRRAPARPAAARQLPIFGADTTEPSPADLAGLLAGPARLDRMGGTARVCIPVDAAWRVHVLVSELVARGLVVNWIPLIRPLVVDQAEQKAAEQAEETAEEPDQDPPDPVRDEAGPAFEVRTAYSSRLIGLARAWPQPADRLFLSGPRLRLWVAAAGAPRGSGFALGLDPLRRAQAAEPALVKAGLAGTVSDAGPAYVIVGRKRLARLAELVGDRPEAAPAGVWPGTAAA